MYCVYCGSEMPDDAVMCVKCGKLIPEYEAKLNEKTEIHNNTLPTEKPPVAIADKNLTDIPVKDGGRRISWIFAVLSVTCNLVVLLLSVLMASTNEIYDGMRIKVYTVGTGILELIMALFALLFAVLSCSLAGAEMKKAGLKSDHLFPAAVSTLLSVAMLVIAIVTMAFAMITE